MNGGFKYHCGQCFNEWQPGPTTFCPRCGATTVLAGPSPRQGPAAPGGGSTTLHVLLIVVAIIAIFFAFGFAKCTRFFTTPSQPTQSR